MTGREETAVLRTRRPRAVPHETPAIQFTGGQFESYRRLGREVAAGRRSCESSRITRNRVHALPGNEGTEDEQSAPRADLQPSHVAGFFDGRKARTAKSGLGTKRWMFRRGKACHNGLR